MAFKKGLSKYKEERLEVIANKYNLNYKDVEEGFTNLMLSTKEGHIEELLLTLDSELSKDKEFINRCIHLSDNWFN